MLPPDPQKNSHLVTTLAMELAQSSPSLLMFLLLLMSTSSSALLSPKGVNYEVEALMSWKNVLNDPNGVLKAWDRDSVDPCSWAIVSCSQENLVIELKAPNSNLSGHLSQSIGNLTHLETIDLSYNNLSGPVPRSSAKTFKIAGNPMICSADVEKECDGNIMAPNSYSLKSSQSTLPLAKTRSHTFAIAFGSIIGCVMFISL